VTSSYYLYIFILNNVFKIFCFASISSNDTFTIMNSFVAAPGSARKGISSGESTCPKDIVEQEEG
jgi:hypothetical protein